MKKIICLILTLSMLLSLIFTSGALSFLKGDMNGDDQVDNKDAVSLFRFLSSTDEEKLKSTSDEYFIFTLLENDTYEIKAKDVDNMPSSIIIQSTHNGKAVTSIGNDAFKGCPVLRA